MTGPRWETAHQAREGPEAWHLMGQNETNVVGGSALVSSDASIETLIGLGCLMGCLHVFTGPDHISAIVTLSVGQTWRAFWLGARWGLGHSCGLLIMFAIISSINGDVPAAHIAEWLVGFLLMGVGLYVLRQARKEWRDGKEARVRGNNAHNVLSPEEIPGDTLCSLVSGAGGSGRGSRAASLQGGARGYTEEGVKCLGQGPEPFEWGGLNPLAVREGDEEEGKVGGEASCVLGPEDAVHVSMPPTTPTAGEDGAGQGGGGGKAASCALGPEDEVHVDILLETTPTSGENGSGRGWGGRICAWVASKGTLQKVMALVVGIFHGFAGPGGVLGVLPAVSLHDSERSACYLGAFCLASVVAMGCFAASWGELSARVGSSMRVRVTLLALSGLLDVAIGILWVVLMATGLMEQILGH